MCGPQVSGVNTGVFPVFRCDCYQKSRSVLKAVLTWHLHVLQKQCRRLPNVVAHRRNPEVNMQCVIAHVEACSEALQTAQELVKKLAAEKEALELALQNQAHHHACHLRDFELVRPLRP